MISGSFIGHDLTSKTKFFISFGKLETGSEHPELEDNDKDDDNDDDNDELEFSLK